MAKRSISEVGHAKNAANFNAMIDILTEMGPLYNPAGGIIMLENLVNYNGLLTDTVVGLSSDFPPYRQAVTKRSEWFRAVPVMGRRIKNAYFALPTSPGNRKNVQSLLTKLREGGRVVTVSETQETRSISTSQLSYDNKTATLQNLISMVNADPLYASNEEDLTPDALRQYLKTTQRLNNEVSVTSVRLLTGRKKRNDLMYGSDPNMLDIVQMVKSYLRSVEGAEEYYLAVKRLKFKDNQ